MIYVTHDQVEAMTLADKIVVLRAGNIEQIGAPLELYDDPDNQFVAGFVGSPKMNFMAATVVEAGRRRASTVELANHGGARLTQPLAGPLPAAGEQGHGRRAAGAFRRCRGKATADLTVKVDVVEHLGRTSYRLCQDCRRRGRW